MVVTQKKEKKEVVISKAVDKHKIWLVAGIALAAVLVLTIILYSSKKAVVGKVIEGVDYAGPIAHYTFDDSLNLGNDVVGRYDGLCTVPNCPTSIDGVREGAVQFSGSSDQNQMFSIPYPLPLNGDFTIMFWLNSQGSGCILSETTQFICISEEEKLQLTRMRSDGTSITLTSVSSIPLNIWSHYALVRSGSITTLYYNGALEATHSGFSGMMDFNSIGTGRYGPLDGGLDDFKIFTMALTPDQIRASAGISTDIVPVENTQFYCNDEHDNDGDGAVDCADTECARFTDICEYPEKKCEDHIDNDGDGRVDCADNTDCLGNPVCPVVSLAQQRASALAQINTRQTQFNTELGIAGERIAAADRTRLRNSANICANTARVSIQATTATSASISTALARGLACFNSPNAQLDSANSAAAGCSNQADDDGDAMVDCGDGDCGAVTVCQSTVDPLGTLRADAAAEIETRYAEVVAMLPAAGEKMTTANRRAYNLDLEDVRRDGRAAVAAATTEAGITAAREEAFTNFIGFSSDIETDIRAAAGCSNGVDEDDPDLIVDCEDTDCSALALCVSGDSDIDGDGVMDTAEPAACRNTPATHGSVSANGCEEGDANQDGIINMDDAIAVARHVLGIADLPDLTSAHARCPRGAEVSMDDAIAIARFTLGIIDSLACT